MALNGRIDNPSKYWQARSLIQAKRSNEAENLLKELATNAPMDYYGMEAVRVLKTMNITCEAKKPGQPFPDTKLSLSERSHKEVAAALKLMELGLDELALINIEALPRSTQVFPGRGFFDCQGRIQGRSVPDGSRQIICKFFSLYREPA